jgi:LemA protein
MNLCQQKHYLSVGVRNAFKAAMQRAAQVVLMQPWLIAIIVVVAVVLLAIIWLYNALVRLHNEIKNSVAQIDVQLKRRHDLIPKLVDTVKGYMKHEKGVLVEITKARAAVESAGTLSAKAKASDALSATLKSLFAVSENYPQLKASANFLQLQEEISGCENKIGYARQHYNDVVMMFNNKIQVFPNSVIAGTLGFKKEESFEATEKERKDVKVEI